MVWDTSGAGGVHVDIALTNISIGWPNSEFVGNRLFPVVPVLKQSNFYYVFNRESWALDPGGDVRAPGSVANEIPGMKVSTQPYFAREHALQIPVTDEERQNTDSPFQPDVDGTVLVTNKVLLQREIVMQQLVTTAANYPVSNTVTLAGTTQWNDYVNSDPIKNFKDAIRQIHSGGLFMRANTVVMPWQVLSILEDHPDFIERIKYSERGILTQEIIAAVIGISNVIVPGVALDSANPGQSPALGYLWGKDVVICWVPPSAGLKTPAFGYEFVWSYGTGMPQSIDRWREEPRVSDIIRCRRRYDIKLTALDANGKSIAGYVIKNAIA